MKKTYEEILIGILLERDYPMKVKELISEFQKHFYSYVKPATLRQILYIACFKSVICQVKLDGFKGYYCLPQWFNGSFLKDQYKVKIYESKSVQVQQSSDSLGRTTRLPIQ